MILKIAFDNKALFLELPDEQRFQIYPELETNYFIKEFDAQIAFSETSAGKPAKLKLIQGSSIQPGDYVDVNQIAQAPPAPDVLTGAYYQKQLDVIYVLTEKDGELVLQLPDTFEKYLNFSSVSLNPMAGDVFNSDKLGVVEFLRNEKKEMSGFRFNDVGRLRNISFSRME